MSLPTQLTLLEELVLLGIDDTTGSLRQTPPLAFGYALAGALLSDLALRNRIDTDPAKVFVIDPSPTGDTLLDQALTQIAAESEPRPVSRWLATFSYDRGKWEQAALSRLVARNILRIDTQKILWVFGVRRYPLIDNREVTEVKTRLSALILGDDIPDPRDAVLISLLAACNLVSHVFPEPAYAHRSERIARLARLEQIGRDVGTCINDLARAIMAINPMGG